MSTAVSRTLARARAAWRGSEVLGALARWLAPVLGALLLLLLLDNLLHLGGVLRLVLGLLWVLGTLAFFGLVVVPRSLRRRSLEATARLVEERLGVGGNVLINALQLARDARAGGAPVPEAALAEVAARAEKAAGLVDVARLWRFGPLVKAVRVAGAALLAVLAYALLFPDHAANAVHRYRDPLGEVMPLTNVRLDVSPGDAEAVAGTTVEVRVRVGVRQGDLPSAALLLVRGAGEPWETRTLSLSRTSPGEREFAAGLGPLAADLEYQVRCGDARSPVWRVRVIQPPSVASVRLVVDPPAYTGEARAEILDPAVLRGLRGTKASLSFVLDRAPLRAALRLPAGEPLLADASSADRTATFAFEVTDPGTLALSLRDPSGAAPGAGRAAEAWSLPVTVLADAPPRVRIAADSPSQIVPPGADVALTATAEDDYGLKGVRFLVERASTGAGTELKTWRYAPPGERRVVERLVVPLDPEAFVPGETYRFVAEAGDHDPAGGHLVRSEAVVVRVARAGELRVPEGSPLASPFEGLRRLVERQRTAISQTVGLLELEEEHVAKGRHGARAVEMAGGQAGIRRDAVLLAVAFAAADGGREVADALQRLDGETFREIERVLAPVAPGAGRAVLRRALEEALPLQRRALAGLEALLGRIALDAARKTKEEGATGDDQGRALAEELRKKAESLREFLEEQRKIVDLTRELDRKNPEDWTEEDERLLGRLEAQELKWAKFLEEAFTDLSKVPDQDFADSSLLEEFNQVYMEVKKAADALAARKTEIAVPLEQSGLELAERLEHNLERWIPDTPDREKWEMEEPEGDFDVPLADLPDELEDIVGDLIDDAEEMDEDVEDVSSSWMDSVDKGAGWDATDGPISNMSARGITGNRLPNQNEVGGRSGEGRSGRSHGQFVEKTAEGKGGRETPTRLTEDPFESGAVRDRSNEASGGATGGGKLAGEGVEGLRGRVPPPVRQKLDRLAAHQGELRQRAERLARVLRRLHLPGGDVDDAAKLLAWSEGHLREAVGFDLRAAHTRLKDALARARASLAYEAETLRERGADLPPRVRDELLDSLKRVAPTGYEDVLRAYYQAIAEGR